MEEYDERYKGAGSIWGNDPSSIVVKASPHFPLASTVLDLGCGEGRNAIYAASQGHRVVAIDSSFEGIKKVKARAKKEGISLISDVIEINEYVSRCPDYDVILGVHILQFFSEQKIPSIINHIKDKTKPGGINVIASFISKGERHKAFQAKHSRYVFETGELKSYYDNWEILHYEEYFGAVEDHGEGPHQHLVVELIAQKPL